MRFRDRWPCHHCGARISLEEGKYQPMLFGSQTLVWACHHHDPRKK